MISITSQPTSNGLYTCYLPIKFSVTETGNPDYLYFQVRNASGSAINGMPIYKAPNISNVFYFDAADYIKSIHNVRTKQGTSLTAIEELTDIYGKYEVIVSTSYDMSSPTTSNEFYGFSFIDNFRFSNDQTANVINYKGIMYSGDLIGGTPNNIFHGYIAEYQRVVVFQQTQYLALETYVGNEPNNASTIKRYSVIDLAAYQNKLISIPLNKTFISANFLVPPGFTSLLKYDTFRIKDINLNNVRYFHTLQYCKYKEFVFINRYGAKESIVFKTQTNETLGTKSDKFMAHGYSHTGNENFFNTSADIEKINQEFTSEFEVISLKIHSGQKETIKDFFKSPKIWFVENSELLTCNVQDGQAELIKNGRGLEITFKYQIAQKQLSFK